MMILLCKTVLLIMFYMSDITRYPGLNILSAVMITGMSFVLSFSLMNPTDKFWYMLIVVSDLSSGIVCNSIIIAFSITRYHMRTFPHSNPGNSHPHSADDDFMLEIITERPKRMNALSEALHNDKEFIIQAVHLNPDVLIHA